jgi:hypothetical protein
MMLILPLVCGFVYLVFGIFWMNKRMAKEIWRVKGMLAMIPLRMISESLVMRKMFTEMVMNKGMRK